MQKLKGIFIGVFLVMLGYGAILTYAAWNTDLTVSSGDALTSTNWNNVVSNIETNSGAIAGLSGNVASLNNAGSTYTHWGNASCAGVAGVSVLASGYGFNAHYTQAGGSAKVSCVEGGSPGENGTTATYYGDLLYPLMTGDINRMPPGISAYKKVKCSECYVEKTTFTRWGKNSCPTGWNKVYSGYSMGGYYTHKTSDRECVDNENFDASVPYVGYGDIWYGTRMWSNSGLSATDYPTNKYVQCVVCGKD